jgi:phage internal scaffolding protein
MTQQHFKDESDINTIMSKYQRTGFLVDPLVAVSSRPEFGDFSTMSDFMDAQNVIAEANQLFAELPSSIRKRFNNDPAEMLYFLGEPDNKDEAIKLGLVNAPAPPPRAPEPLLVKMVADPPQKSEQLPT